MSLTYSPGSINAGAFIPLKFASAHFAANGDLFTVSTGKTAYILSANISAADGNGAGNHASSLTLDGVQLLGVETIFAQENQNSMPAPVGYGPSLASGKKCSVVCPASVTVTASVWYIEV